MLLTEYNKIAEMKKMRISVAKEASEKAKRQTAYKYSSAAINALINAGMTKSEAKKALEKELKK